MLVSHLLYARIHLSTSVILPACLTDAAWKLGIFIQLLSVCQSREMLFTQHQLDEVQHALCVTGPACSTHSENKDKVWPVPPGCLHFSWPHIVCVGVCNSSRVISLQSSSSRAESYWEIFCIFMTRNTNHNAFILLYRKNPKQNTGDTGKNRNSVFLLCWAVRSASLEGRNTKAIISCFHDNIGENCSVKIFIWVIFVGQQMQEHMIHSIYFLMI